jgi:hypothetical protein
MLLQVKHAEDGCAIKLTGAMTKAGKWIDKGGLINGAVWPAPPAVEIKGPSDRSPSGVSTYRFVWPFGAEKPTRPREMWILREPNTDKPGTLDDRYQINGIQETFDDCVELAGFAPTTNDWVASTFLPTKAIIEKRLEDGRTDIPVYYMVNGDVPSNECVYHELDTEMSLLLALVMPDDVGGEAPSRTNDVL